MKITEIRGYHLAYDLPEPLANSIAVFRTREALLIELRTDAGVTGWGETVASPHAAAAFLRAKLARPGAGTGSGRGRADVPRHGRDDGI